MAQTEQRFDELDFTFEPKEHFLDAKACKKAHKLHEEDELTWAEVAEEVGVSRPGIASLMAHVHENGLIMFRSHKELTLQVQRARDAGEGWAAIGARCGGLTEGRVQKLYEERTEEPYFKSYIGHGGRPREDGAGFQGVGEDGQPVINVDGSLPKPKKSKSKGKSKKSKGSSKSKSNGAPEFNFDDGADEDDVAKQVAKEIEGKTLTVDRPGGKTAELTVTEVLAAAQNKSGDWGVKVKTDDDNERAFALKKITAVA